MKITFELKNKQKVLIKSGKKVIGHIFTPSSSGNSITNAIQVCGFEEAFGLWGCGLFGEKKMHNYNFRAKKDIQLFFTEYENDKLTSFERREGIDNCESCFSHPCICENKNLPFSVKREKDLCKNGSLEYKDNKKPSWFEGKANQIKGKKELNNT